MHGFKLASWAEFRELGVPLPEPQNRGLDDKKHNQPGYFEDLGFEISPRGLSFIAISDVVRPCSFFPNESSQGT